MTRARKRVHAIPRGPDGSAFQNCGSCGLSIAIALADMHDCEVQKNVCKKLKSQFNCNNNNENVEQQQQPRSAFRFFMEEFMKTCKDGNEVEIDKRGFEMWKNMSKAERHPFVLQADKVNSAYVKLLRKEESEIGWVDDEADSAEVGKYDWSYDDYDTYDDSKGLDWLGLFPSESHWSFNSEDSFRSSSAQTAR